LGALFVLYPVVAYYGLMNGMAWFGLLLLILFFSYKAIFVKQQRWYSLGLICILSLGAWFQQSAMIKLVPIIIHVSLFIIFYQSLRSGEPLIEKFARLDFPVFPESMAKHCLQMTKIWVAFFCFNILLNIGLVAWASDGVWALYNGILVYVLIGLLVLGEYGWRRLKFPDLEMPTFKETALRISKNSHSIIGKTHE